MSTLRSVKRALRAPGFFLTVFALVAIVVAVNATAFAALWGLGYKALPYGDADRLVELRADLVNFGFAVGLSESLLHDVVESDGFDGAIGYSAGMPARTDESGRQWRIRRVTPGFTDVLGVGVALGRAFTADDAGADANVVVLSDAAWRSRFAADPGVLGRELRLSGTTLRVIGVLPNGITFPDAEVDAWMPYVATASEREQDATGNVGYFEVVARLQQGVTIEQARSRLDALLESTDNLAGLRQSSGLKADVRRWRDRFTADHWQALALLQLAALALLAVVAANLANVTLDRMLARRREFAICRALGARRGDVVRAVLGDLLPPTLLGALAGVAAMPLGIALLRSRGLLPSSLPMTIGIDAVTVGVAVAVAAMALAFALATALASGRGDPADAGLGQRTQTAGLGRVRAGMLVAQVALTTMLLGGSVLLLRSALNLVNQDPGFDPSGVLITAVDIVGVTRGVAFDTARDSERFAASVEAVRNDVAGIPGVSQVALANMAPFTGWEAVSMLGVPGHDEPVQARTRVVGPAYFAAMGIAVTAGREFRRGDNAASSPVIVDELFRDRWLAGRDALSVTIGLPDGGKAFRDSTIVGVARTVKHEALDEAANLPTVYQLGEAPLPIFMLVTRTQGDPAALLDAVRQRILARAPDAAIVINRTLADAVAGSLTSRRALVEAVGAFGIVTLLLAAIGLYAVLSFAMRRRTPELGVRMALGADAPRIQRLVMGQGGPLIASGVLIGLIAGIPLARLLANRLYHLSSADPLSWALAAVLVAAAALFACWLPARRATRVPPRVALESV